MKNIINQLIKIASLLDKKELYIQSDNIHNVMCKIVTSGYLYPNYLEPIENRVVPFSDMEEEYKEIEKNRLHHPRLIQKEFEDGDASDEEDVEGSIFSLNGEPVSGITQRIYDPASAGYMGMDHFKFKNRDENNKGYPNLLPH